MQEGYIVDTLPDQEVRMVLIDDDQEALHLLENYLKVYPEVNILGMASGGQEGLLLVQELQPDIIFLDIDMPDISGIEIARCIKERNYNTQIVFTTAFNKYAYDVISMEPLDYLTKPFGPERLKQLRDKFFQRLNKEEDERRIEILVRSHKVLSKVKLPTRSGVIVVHPGEVVLVRARGNYSEIYLSDGTVEEITVTLAKLATMLNNMDMYRISRSTMINLKFLQRVDRRAQTCVITINDKEHVESISRMNIRFFEKIKCFPIS